MKNILFISALDFKTRSIEVIKRTPEAYATRGWNVRAVVARDTSLSGNYFYERVVDPEGVLVRRTEWPLGKIYDRTKSRMPKSILLKVRHFLVVIRLAVLARQAIYAFSPDVVYGYEYHGVLAVSLLKVIAPLRLGSQAKTIARYQGTFFYSYIKNKKWGKILRNIDHLVSFFMPWDLCIMTNDGTQGDKLLSMLRPNSKKKKKNALLGERSRLGSSFEEDPVFVAD